MADQTLKIKELFDLYNHTNELTAEYGAYGKMTQRLEAIILAMAGTLSDIDCIKSVPIPCVTIEDFKAAIGVPV